jgi:hypothetical protein
VDDRYALTNGRFWPKPPVRGNAAVRQLSEEEPTFGRLIPPLINPERTYKYVLLDSVVIELEDSAAHFRR